MIKLQQGTVFRRIDFNEVVKIYQPKHIGGIPLRSVIDPGFLKLLRAEVVNMHLLKEAQTGQGAQQNYLRIYLTTDDRESSIWNLQACLRFTESYTSSIYNVIGKMLGFTGKGTVNSFGLHMYPKGAGAADYHKDYKSDINLIGVVPVEGSARVCLARSRKGEGEVSFTIEPGDITLLRSNMGSYKREKADLRPHYKVESSDQDRYSIILREHKNSKRP